MKGYEDLARLKVEEAIRRGVESQRLRESATVSTSVTPNSDLEALRRRETRRAEPETNGPWAAGRGTVASWLRWLHALALPRRA